MASVTVIFLQAKLDIYISKILTTAHFTGRPCVSLMLHRLENALPARKHNHCHSDNGIFVSRGDASKINDVHSINLMGKMSGGLWMRERRAFLWGNMFTSWAVCLQAQRRQWVRPVPTKAPCVQSRTRSTETAGWWVGTMLLSHTQERKGGEKKSRRRKSLPSIEG